VANLFFKSGLFHQRNRSKKKNKKLSCRKETVRLMLGSVLGKYN